MGTKQAMKEFELVLKGTNPNALRDTCVVCLVKFRIDGMSAWWRKRYGGKHVCPMCATRSWPRFYKMMKTLDAIANVACVGEGDQPCGRCNGNGVQLGPNGGESLEEGTPLTVPCEACKGEGTVPCKCPTCFAGRIYDELFPETSPEQFYAPSDPRNFDESVCRRWCSDCQSDFLNYTHHRWEIHGDAPPSIPTESEGTDESGGRVDEAAGGLGHDDSGTVPEVS